MHAVARPPSLSTLAVLAGVEMGPVSDPPFPLLFPVAPCWMKIICRAALPIRISSGAQGSDFVQHGVAQHEPQRGKYTTLVVPPKGGSKGTSG